MTTELDLQEYKIAREIRNIREYFRIHGSSCMEGSVIKFLEAEIPSENRTDWVLLVAPDNYPNIYYNITDANITLSNQQINAIKNITESGVIGEIKAILIFEKHPTLIKYNQNETLFSLSEEIKLNLSLFKYKRPEILAGDKE